MTWAARRFSKLMGITGRAVMTRLLGIILAALAAQFVIDGVVGMLPAGQLPGLPGQP